LSERPFVTRTWSPRGQTPLLDYHFNWKKLSAIAGVTWLRFYFKLYPGSVRQEQVIDFLKHLLRFIKDDLIVIWDGLRSHRGKMVKDFVKSTEGRLELEFLPAYAPELNPVEYLWGYWKCKEMPNFCPSNIAELSDFATKALYRMRRRKKTLIQAFWKQADLFDVTIFSKAQ
jgi:transposase